MFLLSGDGYIGELLELHQECQEPFQGSRGKVGFLSRCRSGKGPYLALRGESPVFFSSCGRKLGVPLKLQWRPQGPAHVASGKSTLHASWERPLVIPLHLVPGPMSSFGVRAEPQDYLGVPMEFQQGSQASSGVETCKSGFLSTCKGSFRIPVMLT